jgi:hypothetical protein
MVPMQILRGIQHTRQGMMNSIIHQIMVFGVLAGGTTKISRTTLVTSSQLQSLQRLVKSKTYTTHTTIRTGSALNQIPTTILGIRAPVT